MRALPVLVLLHCAAVAAADSAADYDADAALALSQAALGNALGDHRFNASDGRSVALGDFAGKPLVISMIFTSCHHVCPTTTRHLASGVANAREVLGKDSFEVVTIGFDSARDTPAAMRAFARAQGVDTDGWHFLSGSKKTIDSLSADLGFQFFPSPRGFDHLNQTTIVDQSGIVYNQVYGVRFELPWLIEPLKQLVYNRPGPQDRWLDSFVDRVLLFCTVYDPTSGRYAFDKSLFLQVGIGFMMVVSVACYLWFGLRQKPQA